MWGRCVIVMRCARSARRRTSFASLAVECGHAAGVACSIARFI